MKKLTQTLLGFGLLLLIAGTALAGSLDIRLENGKRWRGTSEDVVSLEYKKRGATITAVGKITRLESSYLVIEGEVGGLQDTATIFRTDIVSIETVDDGADDSTASDTPAKKAKATSGPKGASSRPDRKNAVKSDLDGPGVILLPLRGGVGIEFRNDEIKRVGEEADKLGRGQIIVLLIDSNGGSSFESMEIAETIFDIRKRHRVVAWIKKAISAGCQTAMCCSEIYFMTDGNAGAITTWMPATGQSIKGEELEAAMEHLADIAVRSGYDRSIADAMKTNKAMCSYDKDPVTGQVTFYNDLSGQYDLSDDNSNLSFTASVAEHCGFSKGTADTEEDLAKLLDLEEWNEVSTLGRKIAEDWYDTVQGAQREIPKLIQQRGYKNAGQGAAARLGALIKINRQLISWWRRCPNVARSMLPPEEELQREIKGWQRELADQNRR